MDLFTLLVGAATLTLGRALFWLFLGLGGFVAGLLFATDLMAGTSEWLLFAVAVVCGFLGLIIAIFLQKLAVMVLGLLAGGYLAISIAETSGHSPDYWPIAFAIGAVIGAASVYAFFDWALIALSACLGATLIIEELTLEPSVELLIFGGLVLFGFLIQSYLWQEAPPPKRRRV